MPSIHDEALSGSLTSDSIKAYLKPKHSIIDSRGAANKLTPLAAASSRGHIEVIELLLKNGANVNALSSKNRTALFHAVSRPGRVAVVRALIASPSIRVDIADDSGNTPLIIAIGQTRDKEVVHELVDMNANISHQNNKGQSAESLAKKFGMEQDLKPKKDRGSTRGAIIDLAVSAVLFVISYANNSIVNGVVGGLAKKLYGISGTRNDKLDKDINTIQDPRSVGAGTRTSKGASYSGPVGANSTASAMPPVGVSAGMPGLGHTTTTAPSRRAPIGSHPTAPIPPTGVSAKGPIQSNPRASTVRPAGVPTGTPGLAHTAAAAPSPGAPIGIHSTMPTFPPPAGPTKMSGNINSAHTAPPPESRPEDPINVATFVANLDTYVTDTGLEKFFPPGDRFLQRLTEKAMKLRDDPTTDLGSPENIKRLTILSLYQPVIYCDDSSSMSMGNRLANQSELVTRIARIATKIVPDNLGVELRFINADVNFGGSAEAIDAAVRAVQPGRGTRIGNSLREKILRPLVYDVISKPGGYLRRPLLVCIITDGAPSGEPEGELKGVIVKCRQTLVKHGYEPNAVMFCVNQIGDDPEAKRFLKVLREDRQIGDVVYCTADQVDAGLGDLKDNQRKLEVWLLELLTKPIIENDLD